MTNSGRVPDDALASLVELASACLAAAPYGLADDAVVAVRDAELLGRLVDGLRVRAAGLVAAESAVEFGAEGLSRRNGFPTVAKFLAALTGASEQSAAKRLAVAKATRSTVSLVGMPNPSRFPVVEQGLREGSLGFDAAVVITQRLGDAASRCGFTTRVAEAEQVMVELSQESAGGLSCSANQLNGFAHRLCDHLDPDGARPAEEKEYDERSVTLKQLATGSWAFHARLPRADGAALNEVLSAILKPGVKPCFIDSAPTPGDPASDTEPSLDSGDPSSASPQGAAASPGTAAAETRSSTQRKADAFITFIAMIAGQPQIPTINGAAPTINVHADLDDILAGRGVGWVDGLDAPLSDATVQQLLCTSDIITTVLGENGQVLQHGKTRRLFSPAQRRAMAVRDGGCVWPGCDRPPSWAEAHHVEEWSNDSFAPGKTDIENGMLLCHHHHHNLHTADWKPAMIDGVPHFIPPPSIDWRQVPVPSTRQRTRTRDHWWPGRIDRRTPAEPWQSAPRGR